MVLKNLLFKVDFPHYKSMPRDGAAGIQGELD